MTQVESAGREATQEKADGGQRHLAVIIGAGYSGIGTAIKLLEGAITDFVILERAEDVGGTWRDNTYPGVACDIPIFSYSYSFALNPDWSRAFAGGEEILSHVHGVVEQHGLRRFIRFGQEVVGLQYDEAEGVWTTTTASGDTFVSRVVVDCHGPLIEPKYPDIRGVEEYQGHRIHSARWDHDYDFRGKKVAVIGSGASAVQIVPELVKTGVQLQVFQRNPGWILPRPDFRIPKPVQWLFRRFPKTQQLVRAAFVRSYELAAYGLVWNTFWTGVIRLLCRFYRNRKIKDTWLRRQLAPQYQPGCKRMLLTSDYYPALQEPNCTLVSWPIATMTERGIKTCDGVERVFDCVVFATGYDVSTSGTPYPIHGVGGRDLNEEWSRGPYGYRSVAVSGYPNLFFTFGPNSGPGHNSAMAYMEAEVSWIAKAVGMIVDQDLRSMDVRPQVQADYNEELQSLLAKTTWNSGCSSWYLTKDGFNPSMFPGFAMEFVRQLADVRVEDFVLTQNPGVEQEAPALTDDIPAAVFARHQTLS